MLFRSASANANAGDDAGSGSKHPGMSAADAKESIGKLSLKERMAALQGSTAFGAPAGGAPPPRPTGEKPKWKPPPVVQRVEPIGGEDDAGERPAAAAISPSGAASEGEGVERVRSPPAEGETKAEEGEGEAKEEGEPDPEEEERQRRAALAARMARLGGARVGMGPPIFAKKPDIPPKRLSKSEEKPKEEKPAEDVLKEEKPIVVSPPAEGAPEGEYLFLSIGVRRAGMTMFHLQVSPWRKLLLLSCPLLSQRAKLKAQAVRTHALDI